MRFPGTTRKLPLQFTFIAFTLIIPTQLFASSLAESSYHSDLRAAEKKAIKNRIVQDRAGALSSSLIKNLFGRYYEVGDSWDVLSWRTQSNIMRMVSAQDLSKQQVVSGGRFHYEVISVKTGIKPSVIIQVTQKEESGLSIPDPKVKYLSLTMNDQMVQSAKEYFFVGRMSGQKVSPDGIHTNISDLELFPIDVPELVSADRSAPTHLPELPQKISNYSTKYGFKPDLSRSSWFEQEDFFGRPIEVLWEQGNPWPSYFKTTNGISILIQKGVSS